MKITVSNHKGPTDLDWKDVPYGAVVKYVNRVVSTYWLKAQGGNGVKLDTGSIVEKEHMTRPNFRYIVVQAELVITP